MCQNPKSRQVYTPPSEQHKHVMKRFRLHVQRNTIRLCTFIAASFLNHIIILIYRKETHRWCAHGMQYLLYRLQLQLLQLLLLLQLQLLRATTPWCIREVPSLPFASPSSLQRHVLIGMSSLDSREYVGICIRLCTILVSRD